MDILDILLDILLKPPQPFIGLFLFLCYHFYKKLNETVTQWYITAVSIWSENVLSFEVEYELRNVKCVLFSMVLFNLNCTMVSIWQNTVIYEML